MFDPTAAQLALRTTRAHLTSAHPGAPVVAAAPITPTPRTYAVRTRLATRLHSVARWVEPAPRSTCQAS